MQTPRVQATTAKPLADFARQAVRQSLRAASRSRNTWQFMAWTYVLTQIYSHDGFFSDGWHTHGQDGDLDFGSQATVDSQGPVFSDQGDVLLQTAANDDGSDVGAAPHMPEFHSEPSFYATIGSGGAAASTLEGSASGEGSALHGGGSLGSAGGGGASFSSGYSYSAGSAYSNVASQPAFAPYDGPPITFFGGLGSYTDKLGFGTDPSELVKSIATTFAAPTLGALGFAANPVEAIPVWQSMGQAPGNMQLHAGDSAHAHWLVQADGYNSQGSAQLQGSNAGPDNSTLAQTVNLDTKTVGNTATLTDSHDWANTLVVKGNYYEFNTIVQVNIVWNNDTINVLRTGDGGANVPSLIDTGDNSQHNTAQIIDTGPASPAAPAHNTSPAHTGADVHQLVMGGTEQHFAVIQASSLSEVDNLGFNFNDILQGNVTVAGIPKFADVKTGGNDQGNSVDIWTGPQVGLPTITPQKFLSDHLGIPTEYVNGDYYNFNTIFQLNVTSNSDSISKTIGGDPSGGAGATGAASQDGTGIIASGGNIQFNDATIVKNDHSDDLFVGGKYTQYNLVLQLNVLANNSAIDQTSKVVHSGSSSAIPAVDDPGAVNSNTHGDHNGSSGSSVHLSLPSHTDELALRGGQTVDTML